VCVFLAAQRTVSVIILEPTARGSLLNCCNNGLELSTPSQSYASRNRRIFTYSNDVQQSLKLSLPTTFAPEYSTFEHRCFRAHKTTCISQPQFRLFSFLLLDPSTVRLRPFASPSTVRFALNRSLQPFAQPFTSLSTSRFAFEHSLYLTSTLPLLVPQAKRLRLTRL
jgi:hypothetical protein